jgi:hypothetical protein
VFDWGSEIGERKAEMVYEYAINFDSMYSSWKFKKQKWAEFKAKRKLAPEIDMK